LLENRVRIAATLTAKKQAKQGLPYHRYGVRFFDWNGPHNLLFLVPGCGGAAAHVNGQQNSGGGKNQKNNDEYFTVAVGLHEFEFGGGSWGLKGRSVAECFGNVVARKFTRSR
jgi:hypothetical protein